MPNMMVFSEPPAAGFRPAS